MEIERKYLIDTLPEDYQDYPCRHIEQALSEHGSGYSYPEGQIINMNSLINQKVSWQRRI